MDIITLAGNFQSITSLQKYCNDQFILLSKSTDKIRQLESDVSHLKTLLASTTPLLNKESLIVTPEEAILDAQINILQERALSKELTLEEVKKLDLLIKNKKIIKEIQPKTYDVKSKPFDPSLISNAELVQIATLPTPE